MSHRPRKTAVKIFFIAASLCLICFRKTQAIQYRFYMHALDRAIILCKIYARLRRTRQEEGTCFLVFGRNLDLMVHSPVKFNSNDRMHMTDDSFKSGLPIQTNSPRRGLFSYWHVAAQGFFCAGGSPDIQIKPAMSAIGMRTPVTIEISEPRRGLTSSRWNWFKATKPLQSPKKAMHPVPNSFSGVPGPAKDVLHTEMGRKILPGLTGGSAAIRITAGRAGTWLRHPAPVFLKRSACRSN